MPYINGIYYFANNAKLHHLPPVLLIHGAGGSNLSWPAEVRRLPGQRVFALDLPGHGKSSGLGKSCIPDYASDVLSVMDALDLYKVFMVGHSMGGGIALNMVMDHPERVLGLGLIASDARLRVSQTILDGLSHPRTSTRTIQTIVDWSFGSQVGETQKKLAARLLEETRPSVLRDDFVACNDFDVSERLQEINKPTLILCGVEDKMTPLRSSERMAGKIPGAALQTIDLAGHMVMLEQPRRVASILNVFINSVEYLPGV